MKYKSRVYAKALASLCLEKPQDQKKIADQFLQYLAKNGDLKKAKEIIALAEKFILQATGNKKIVIETARKTDVANLARAIAKKGDVVEERINPELIAGVKIIINNQEQFDGSLLKKLNTL